MLKLRGRVSFLRDYLSWLSFRASILATDHLILDKFEVIYVFRLSVGAIKGTNTHPSWNDTARRIVFSSLFISKQQQQKKHTYNQCDVRDHDKQWYITITSS